MKRKKIAARICAFVLAAGLAAVDTLPAFATEVSEIVSAPAEREEQDSGGQENNDSLIYVDDVLYSGYYMDSAGILYLVSEGMAEPLNGIVGEGTEYYSCDEAGVMTLLTLPGQTVFVAGKVYNGYYMDSAGILYLVSGGVAEPKTGAVNEGKKYYSCNDAGILTLAQQTLYVQGKVYTGYYLSPREKMYSVKNGTYTLQTGTVKKGTTYYSYNAGETKKLSGQTLYVKGKVYTGYYLSPGVKMYSVKKGTYTLKTGTVKKGTTYYSYNAGKKKKLGKQTLYVKGKVYTGYYLNRVNKMYSVEKGRRTLQTGTVKKGTKYYSYNAGKKKKLGKQTLYVKGKVYTGYYLSPGKKMYSVKKGTSTLVNTMLDAGTRYNYNGKRYKLSRQTLYVEGKVYTGYYLGSDKKMYSVKKGTSTLVNTTLNAGTGYYSCNVKKTLTLPAQTVYVYGKAMEGMSAESLATLQRAQAVVAGITNESMTREQKLRVCFDYVKTAYPEIKPRIPHYTGMDWPVIYANDMFVGGAGNCCSYAAAFAYMAKAIGYEEVYCCNSGGHGWAEIDGLIYDPEWSKWHHVYNYYALSYDTKTDQGYKGAIQGWQQAGKLWMHVKI